MTVACFHGPVDHLGCISYRSTSQVSGIGVESSLLRFARQHFQGAVAFPMMAGTSLFLQANAAAMLPWGAGWQQKPTCISDRFVSRLPTCLLCLKALLAASSVEVQLTS